MKTKLLLLGALLVFGGRGMCSDAASQHLQSESLRGKVAGVFGIERPLLLGTPDANSTLLDAIQATGDRDEIVRHVLSRTEALKMGVSIYYFKALYLSWTEADSGGRPLTAEIQIVLRDRQPIQVFSTIREGEPLPPFQEIPASESVIDVPPGSRSGAETP